MNQNVTQLQYSMREQVRQNPRLKGESADRLTVTLIAMNGLKRFYEGYFGARFKEKLREGARLRRENPNEYAAALERTRVYTGDLNPIRREMRMVEVLTTSDLTYAIGATREAEREDPRPNFRTDLFGLVRRRNRTDLKPLNTDGGVTLARRLLNVRAEGTTNSFNSWVGRGTTYSLMNLEDGFELTWEMLLNNDLDQWNNAMFELGVNAIRTRAWLILDAIRRGATFLELPDANLGPNIANLDAVDAYLGHQVVDGRTYTRTASDVYVPGIYRGVLNRSLNTVSLAVVGGAAGAVQQIPNDNPVYQKAVPHVEEIIADGPIMADEVARGQSNADWIAADAGAQPVEFATLAQFETGARVLTKIPDIVELDNMGSYSEHVIETKVSDVAAAEVRDKTAIVLVRGR